MLPKSLNDIKEIAQSAVVPVGQIVFSEKVVEACRADKCGMYNRNWSCPPNNGTFEEHVSVCSQYENAYIFSTVHEVEDWFDFESMMKGLDSHAETHRRVKAAFGDNVLVLCAGACKRCEKCTCPDSPCRFPDKMEYSVESFGIDVVSTSYAAGLNYCNGKNTVTYFSIIFFGAVNERN